ncbi:MAG: IS110 family transposase [Chloroflexi bacterium]|nr:MAG: IS110 family transposase [Chloroflexota bacterium]
MSGSSSPTPEPVETTHVVGIDIGSQACTMACLTMDKRQVIKPTPFANTVQGLDWLFERLEGLGVAPKQILVGLEATSRYGENLLQALLKRGYQVCLLHPAQMHAFAKQRGMRAKTDQLDATTIARALLSGEARFGYVPSEQVATYRELMRLQHQLSDDVVRYKNEIHALLAVLFPEFTQVFVDPTRPTALAVLKRYPSAQAIAQTEVETLSKCLHELAPRHYGRATAEALVRLAKASISSGLAIAARSSSLRILCDQLEHTQANLEHLQREIDQLLGQDPKATGLLGVPEFGPTTVAVLRAELGDLTRFTRINQVVAYVGLDLQVKQSGKWKGQTKLSKHGSGRVRRILYLAALRSIHLAASPFGAYYQRLLARGMKKGMAVVAVMRKMLIIAVHLIQTEECYDPGKVAVGAGN